MLRHNLIPDLCRYLGQPEAEVMRIMGGAAKRSEDRWIVSSDKGRTTFYQSHPDYVAELTHWHTQFPYRAQWTEQVVAFATKMGLHTALDFGCGIATEGLSLVEAGLDVDLYDVNQEGRPFLQWKIEQYGLTSARVVDVPDAQYDLGILIDVIGHVPNPLELVRELADRCRYLFYAEDFNIGVLAYPMHQGKPPRFDAWWLAHWRPLVGNLWESRRRNLRVCLQPSSLQFRGDVGGVLRHVEALERHLPGLGVVLVPSPTDADIVHTQAISLPSQLALAHVYTNHGVYPVGPPLAPTEARMQDAIWANLCRADAVISVADWPTKRYRERLGITPTIIPNGINLTEWDAVPRGLSGLTPGYLLWAKPTINAVCDPRPAQRLAEALPEGRFVFTLVQPPVSGNVTVTGVLPYERMKAVLADCAVLAATTLEVFSVQTLEAMALGKPVLALWHGGDGGNNEAVIHKETGYIARDETDLVEGARYCLEHAERLGRNGRARVEELYRWPELVASTVEVYQNALRSVQNMALRPRVSVVLPCFNLADLVVEAITSLKAQTEPDWECIVVDDGSTDDSLAAIAKAVDGDVRFLVVRQENAGVSEARNAGLGRAAGCYICHLDADDLFESNALKRMADFLDAHPEVFVAYPDLTAFGDQNGVWRMPEYSDDALRKGNVMPYCSLFRRELVDRGIAQFRVKPYMEDYEFWVNICSRGYQAKRIPEPLLRYRKRAGQGLSEETKHQHADALARSKAMHPEFWRPRVSVVIPCWNQAQYLPAAVGSVLAQTLQDFEVIVVDDGSPDDVLGALAEFVTDLRVKVIRQENKGLSEARNSGVAASLGEFILTLDADDEIDPTFLAKTVAALDANPELAIAYTDIQHTALNGNGERANINVTECPEYDFDQLLKRNLFINSALQRRYVWERVGGYNPNMAWGYEDWDYWISAGERGFCAGRIPEPLFRYLFKTAEQGSMIMGMKPHRSDAIRQMHENHVESYAGRKPMGCCGQGHVRAPSAARVAASPAASVGQMQLVDVEFAGKDLIPFSLRGPVTKAVYRNVSVAIPIRQFDPRDAEVLVATDPRFRWPTRGGA